MRSSQTWLGLAVILAGLAAGCSAPPCATTPTVSRVTAETPEAYEHLWNSVGDTLRARYFRLDRQDRLEGIITTHPETSAQFFELWRPQSTSAFYWAEDNLNTIQLAAKVTVKPVEGVGAYELGVEVDRTRLGLEERQVDNSAGAMRLYSEAVPTESGRKESPSQTGLTIPLGRDKPAEEQLLKAILHRYAKPPAADESCGSCETEVVIEEKPAATATQPE